MTQRNWTRPNWTFREWTHRNWIGAALMAAAFGWLACAPAAAQGQGPTVRIIYPFAPGGGGDAIIRLLAERLSTKLNQTFVVDNRSGASGRIGIVAVKGAAPDGLTFLYTPFAAMTLYPFTFKQLDYDPVADFEPLSQIAEYDFGMAVNNDVPAKTVKELVAWLKANPAKAQFGHPGAGALPHFFGILFGNVIGVEMTHIAYRGSPPALADLVAGQIPIMVTGVGDLQELHRSGRLRIIATTGTERSLPDIPTFKESGFDLLGRGWFGTFLPKKTPPEVIGRLSKAIMEIVAQPDVKARYVALGYRPKGTSPAELAAIQKADAEQWAPVIKKTGFVAD